MTALRPDTHVATLVLEQPSRARVFERFGIDYCCGGKSLAYACRERGLDAAVVLARLLRCVGDEEQPRRERLTEGG